MAYRQFGTSTSTSSNGSPEEHEQRRRLPADEVIHRSAEQLEQAQHVLEAAAGILDASSWEGPASLSTMSSTTMTTSAGVPPASSSRPQPQAPTLARSNPIAIRRKYSDEFSSSSSSEDDDNTTEDTSNRLAGSYDPDTTTTTTKQRRAAQSLPQQYYLLRAPHLGSLPTRHAEECVPAISLSEPAAREDEDAGRGREQGSIVSYGSLRESQLQGRFLDGPRSFYRETRTGQLRQRSSGGGDSGNRNLIVASSAPVPQGLSIGERIQQSRQQQMARAQKNSHPPHRHPTASSSSSTTSNAAEQKQTSSLAAMLEDVTAAVNPKSTRSGNPWENAAVNTQGRMQAASLVDESDFHDHPTDMLSTSLTGLEILQRGLRQQQQQQQSLPYSTKKNNASVSRSRSSSMSTQQPYQQRQSQSTSLLSRSLSDRQYESRRTPLHQSVFHPSGGGGGAQFLIAPDTAAFGSHGNRHTLPYHTTAAGYRTHRPPSPPAASTANGLSFAASSILTQPFPAAAATSVAAPYLLHSMDVEDALPDDNPDAEGAFDMDFE